MPRPVVAATVERLYATLPAFYRDADEAQPEPGYPLLRYLSLLGDQAGEVEALLDRFQAGDLVDPELADPGWLDWLAQHVGATYPRATSTADRRQIIATASSGWRSGNRESIATAARTVLTGTRYVEVVTHYDADPWKIGVRTREDETDDPADVVDAINRLRARPAGVLIVTAFYAASWDTLVAHYPTWTLIEATGSWEALQATQP